MTLEQQVEVRGIKKAFRKGFTSGYMQGFMDDLLVRLSENPGNETRELAEAIFKRPFSRERVEQAVKKPLEAFIAAYKTSVGAAEEEARDKPEVVSIFRML